MAECTVSRCSHERRVFRKELHKWSKEILCILGLERLAEELMGARKWQILVQPFKELENEDPIDWFPEDTCYFCYAKKQPPYDPASGMIPSIENYNALRIDTDELSASSDQGNLPGSVASCISTLFPWHSITSAGDNITNTPQTLDQPLDLSVNSHKATYESRSSSDKSPHSKNYNHPDNGLCANSVLKVPQIPIKVGHKRRMDVNSKRTYTEDELQAAIRDIQSGKLGTRRAAVIYGIPRSTLRNKVYKLANESKSRRHFHINHQNDNYKKSDESLKSGITSVDCEVPNYDCENKQNNSSASESLRQLLKHTITQKSQCVTKTTEKQNSDGDNIPSSSDIDTVNENPILDGLEYSQNLAPFLSHVFSDIQHLGLLNSKASVQSFSQSFSALKEDCKLPLLPDLIRRLVEERIELGRNIYHFSGENYEDGSTDMLSGNLSNVILKVPSFKPVKSVKINDTEDSNLPDVSSSCPSMGESSHLLSGNRGITVTLKELIARSISQKVNWNLENTSAEDDPSTKFSFASSSAENATCSLSWNLDNFSKREKDSLSNSNNSASENSKVGKRTRPKRGRYRNYDRDNLARAVRAVQKGEMSVHRAGTFYGVPHSTLEYKVKERHLLRPRKRDVFNCSSLSDESNPISTSKLNPSLVVEQNIDSKTINPVNVESCNGLPNKSQPHRPNVDSYPSPLSLWQNMPFFTLDFSQLGSNNFFASQMMRKLQENALNEEMQKKNKNKDLNIIENLLKSTLKRSISPDHQSSLILPTNSVNVLSECRESEETSL